MPQGGRDEAWLRALSSRMGIMTINSQPLLPLSSTYTSTGCQSDENKANSLLAEASEIRRKGQLKKPIDPAKIKKDKWAYDDFERVLTENIRAGTASVEVFESILSTFRSHKPRRKRTSLLSRRKQATDDETDELFLDLINTALNYHQTDMLQLLAHFASPGVVSKILPMAIRARNLEYVQILVEENADPNTCAADFISCVEAGELNFVRLLLQSQIPIEPATTSAALPAAVQRGNIEIVQLLLSHGANADVQNGIAMEEALRADRLDIAVSLLLSQKPPMAETLASLVSDVFSQLKVSDHKKYQFIEVLLNGGAAGERLSSALLGAVQQRWAELVQLLVKKGASINADQGEAYRHAVYQVDLDSLRILNEANLDSDIATDIFEQIDRTRLGRSISPAHWRILAEMLLKHGAVGQVVDEALIDRVDMKDLAAVQTLLAHGASVNYKNGRALDSAVLLEEIDLVDILLDTRPAISTLNAVFPRVGKLSHSVKLQIARKLLDAGAKGPAVDAVLKSAMNESVEIRDRLLIETLVKSGADVGQKQGDLLRLAVQTGDLDVLQTLLLGSPSPSLLCSCVPLAMELSDPQRYKILETLLRSGARGDEVSRALVESIDGTHSGYDVATLLLTLGEANTSFDKGQAFKKAIGSNMLEFLEILTRHNHLSESEFSSCLHFAIDLPQQDNARLEKIRLLLKTDIEISGDIGASALRHEMDNLKQRGEEAFGVLGLLIDAGADVNHNGGSIFGDAIQLGLFECFQLFLDSYPSFLSLEASFEKALLHALRKSDLRYIRELLRGKIPQITRDEALSRTVGEDGNEELALLLLEHDASINFEQGLAVQKVIKREDFSLLAQLLQHDPSAGTIENAFAKAMSLPTIEGKNRAFRLLLEAGTVPGRLLNEALLSATGHGWKMAETCKLLLQHGASPSYGNSAPLCRAIKSNDFHVGFLDLLLSAEMPEDSIGAALICAFDALQGEARQATVDLLLTVAKPQTILNQLLFKAVQEPFCDHSLIKSLLQSHASVLQQEGKCILHVVMKKDIQTLKIIEPYIPGHSNIPSQVFERAWRNGIRAQSPQEAAVLSSLLKMGATGQSIDRALIETIKASPFLSTSFLFVTELLGAGADVNYDHGASLLEASSRGNLAVIEELLAHNPQRNCMTLSFPHVFNSKADSQTIRKIVENFCSHPSAPDLSYESQFGPIMFLVLKNYPNDKELVKFLIKAGCPVDPILKSSAQQEEDLSLLYWALFHENNAIPDDLIDLLIDSGANVNFQTSIFHSTPLHVAILRSRSHTVARLLKSGADHSVETSTGMSPLSLCARYGNEKIARHLLDAGAAINDGSLHYAAQNVNINVIRILVKEMNQSDYQCSKFAGRTALAELCRSAKNATPSQLKEAILLLKDHGNFRQKSNGKSILHFALDNENAMLVTQALLDTFTGAFVNEEFNLFEEGRFRYSPLAYVTRCRNQAPTSQRKHLEELLRQFECKDQYWATEGEQPPDTVNPPDDIALEMKRKRLEQERIDKQREDHRRLLEYEEEKHRQRLALEDEENERRIARTRAEQEEFISSHTARHQLMMRNQLLEAEQTAKLDESTARRRASIMARENSAQVEHRKRMGLLEQAQRDENYNLEKKRWDEEKLHIQGRERMLTSGMEERARIERELYSKRLSTQQQLLANSRQNYPQIEYPDDLD